MSGEDSLLACRVRFRVYLVACRTSAYMRTRRQCSDRQKTERPCLVTSGTLCSRGVPDVTEVSRGVAPVINAKQPDRRRARERMRQKIERPAETRRRRREAK